MLTHMQISAHWAAMSDATSSFMVVPFNPLVHEDDPHRLLQVKIQNHVHCCFPFTYEPRKSSSSVIGYSTSQMT